MNLLKSFAWTLPVSLRVCFYLDLAFVDSKYAKGVIMEVQSSSAEEYNIFDSGPDVFWVEYMALKMIDMFVKWRK